MKGGRHPDKGKGKFRPSKQGAGGKISKKKSPHMMKKPAGGRGGGGGGGGPQKGHAVPQKKMAGKARQQPVKTNARVPYTEEQKILVVGEGNFSFCRGLCELLMSGKNMVATTLDDQATMKAKYDNTSRRDQKEGKKQGDEQEEEEEEEEEEEKGKAGLGAQSASENVRQLKEDFEVQVLFDFDATKMGVKHDRLTGKFDRIVFNFPHAGKIETFAFWLSAF